MARPESDDERDRPETRDHADHDAQHQPLPQVAPILHVRNDRVQVTATRCHRPGCPAHQPNAQACWGSSPAASAKAVSAVTVELHSVRGTRPTMAVISCLRSIRDLVDSQRPRGEREIGRLAAIAPSDSPPYQLLGDQSITQPCGRRRVDREQLGQLPDEPWAPRRQDDQCPILRQGHLGVDGAPSDRAATPTNAQDSDQDRVGHLMDVIVNHSCKSTTVVLTNRSPACGNVYGPSTAPNANSHTPSDGRPPDSGGWSWPALHDVRAVPGRAPATAHRDLDTAPSRRRCTACEHMVAGRSEVGCRGGRTLSRLRCDRFVLTSRGRWAAQLSGLNPDVMRRLIFALARRCWHRQPQLQVYNCCPNQCSPACGQGNVYGPSTAPNANSHTRSDRARPIRGDGRGQPCTTSVPCRAGPRRRLIGTSTPAPSRRRCTACEHMVAGQSRSGLPWWSNAVEVAMRPLSCSPAAVMGCAAVGPQPGRHAPADLRPRARRWPDSLQ